MGRSHPPAVALFPILFALLPAVSSAQPRPQPPSRPARGAAVPEGVQAYRDMAYVEGGHERQKLDLFVPKDSDGLLPLVIWIHGGGWQGGSKNGCPPLRAGYTDRGYAVASIGYRLSGDAVFPAQIEDCKAAIRWLRAHAEQYGLDPDRFGVWGSSAGGHLVALVGTSGDVKDFDVGANLDQPSRVQAVCDYYGPTDFTVFVTTPGYQRHARDDSPEARLLGGAVMENKDKAARANSITYVDKDAPPFLIVHGDRDGTVPLNQSQLLFDALKAAGVSVHFHTIHGAGHGGPGFNDPKIADMVREFFEKKLKQSATEENGPTATTSESTAAEPEQAGPPAGAERGPGISWQAIVGRRDANRDGKIDKDEFPGPPALFERLDRDDDGAITEEEHNRVFPPR